MRTAQAGIMENAAGSTPRYKPLAPSPRNAAKPAPPCNTTLTVSSGWNATVAAAAAAPPAAALRTKLVSRCFSRCRLTPPLLLPAGFALAIEAAATRQSLRRRIAAVGLAAASHSRA